MRKIMIDTGMNRRVNCRGVEPETVELIGNALSRELDARGCETVTSCGVPDLDEGSGRPSRCADVARRWGADCCGFMSARRQILARGALTRWFIGGSPARVIWRSRF